MRLTGPGAAPLAIIHGAAANTAEQLSLLAWRERRSECGGLLWGTPYVSSSGIVAWIAAVTPAVGAASAVGFELAPASCVFGQGMLRLAGFPPALEELGVWHSHPRYTSFLSAVDQEYFDIAFPAPWQVSLVIDPVTPDRGVYMRTNKGTQRVPGFTYSGEAFGRIPVIDPVTAWLAMQENVQWL